MDVSRLTTGDKVIGGSGLALLVFSFLPWFSFGAVTQSGWHFFVTGVVPVLLGLIMVAWVIATRLAEVDLPEVPVPEGLVLLVLGGAAAALIILRLVAGDGAGRVTSDRSIGLFLSVLAAIGLVTGAFLRFQEDGGALVGGGTTSSRSRGTPPTPF